jgi:hypothetical protein
LFPEVPQTWLGFTKARCDKGSMTASHYRRFEPQSREDLVQALSSNDAQPISDALYSSAQHESDWGWSQRQCLKFLNHNELGVRWAAAFVARFHRVVSCAPCRRQARHDSAVHKDKLSIEDFLQWTLAALYSDYSTSGRHRRSCREGGDPVRYGLR